MNDTASPTAASTPATHVSVHVISTIVTLGFMSFLFILAFRVVDATPLMNVMTGVLAAGFGSVVQFYLGSSLGDAQKSQHISSIIQANVSNGKPPV